MRLTVGAEGERAARRTVFWRDARVGFQYVAQSRQMRSVLLRVAIFFPQSTALLALLPLVAKRMPDGGAWVYTLLLASSVSAQSPPQFCYRACAY